MPFVVVDRNPNGAVVGEEVFGKSQTIFHEGEPSGVIEVVVVAEAVGAGIERRVNVNAFDFRGENFFERGEREEVVALDD